MPANTPEKRDTHRLGDYAFRKADALPAAGLTTYSTGLDLATILPQTAKGASLAECIFSVRVPNMTVAGLVDADTLKVSVMVDSVAPIDASSKAIMPDIISMLGAGGVGDLGEEFSIKVPVEGFYYQGTKYPVIGVRVAHTGTGVPSGEADGTVHTALLF